MKVTLSKAWLTSVEVLCDVTSSKAWLTSVEVLCDVTSSKSGSLA